MKRVKLENVLSIILNEFSLDINDIDLELYGLEDEPKYIEIGVNFYRDFNSFEAVYIQNTDTHLYELFHENGPEIIHQCANIATEKELKVQIKESNLALERYSGYVDFPIVRLSDIEKEKQTQKSKGIFIRGKYYAKRD